MSWCWKSEGHHDRRRLSAEHRAVWPGRGRGRVADSRDGPQSPGRGKLEGMAHDQFDAPVDVRYVRGRLLATPENWAAHWGCVLRHLQWQASRSDRLVLLDAGTRLRSEPDDVSGISPAQAFPGQDARA